MPRFTVQGQEELDASITLRCSKAEKLKLREDANLAGLSLSELIRRQYFRRPIVPAANMEVVREIRRQGGLLKHLIAATPHGEYDDAVKHAIQLMDEYIRVLTVKAKEIRDREEDWESANVLD